MFSKTSHRSEQEENNENFQVHMSDELERQLRLANLPPDIHGALLEYFREGQLKVSNKNFKFISALLGAAATIGLFGVTDALRSFLRLKWYSMIDTATVVELSKVLQMELEMLNIMANDVINLLLGVKSTGIESNSLTFQTLISLLKTEAFWVSLNDKCTYSFTYELFYKSILKWILKSSGQKSEIDELVHYLRLETVTPETVFSVIRDENSYYSIEIRQVLLSSVKNQYTQINKALKGFILNVQIFLYDTENGSITVKELSGDITEWRDIWLYDSLGFEPITFRPLDDDIYVFGEQKFLIISKSELKEARYISYPEHLCVEDILLHKNEVYLLGRNDSSNISVYKCIPESRALELQSACPLHKNVSAVSYKERIYVIGKTSQTDEHVKGFSIFKYDEETKTFSSTAFIAKHWINSDDDLKSITRFEKTQMIVCNDHLYVVFYDQIVNFQSTVYIAEINVDDEAEQGQKEICADKCLGLRAMDKYSSLEYVHPFDKGNLLFVWSKNLAEGMSISLYEDGVEQVKQLGFLPNFQNSKRYHCKLIEIQVKEFKDREMKRECKGDVVANTYTNFGIVNSEALATLPNSSLYDAPKEDVHNAHILVNQDCCNSDSADVAQEAQLLNGYKEFDHTQITKETIKINDTQSEESNNNDSLLFTTVSDSIVCTDSVEWQLLLTDNPEEDRTDKPDNLQEAPGFISLANTTADVRENPLSDTVTLKETIPQDYIIVCSTSEEETSNSPDINNCSAPSIADTDSITLSDTLTTCDVEKPMQGATIIDEASKNSAEVRSTLVHSNKTETEVEVNIVTSGHCMLENDSSSPASETNVKAKPLNDIVTISDGMNSREELDTHTEPQEYINDISALEDQTSNNSDVNGYIAPPSVDINSNKLSDTLGNDKEVPGNDKEILQPCSSSCTQLNENETSKVVSEDTLIALSSIATEEENQLPSTNGVRKSASAIKPHLRKQEIASRQQNPTQKLPKIRKNSEQGNVNLGRSQSLSEAPDHRRHKKRKGVGLKLLEVFQSLT